VKWHASSGWGVADDLRNATLLVYPWFAGMAPRPVIDWVAGEDPTRMLEMLTAA
jgi:hypothetical protein